MRAVARGGGGRVCGRANVERIFTIVNIKPKTISQGKGPGRYLGRGPNKKYKDTL